MSSGCRSAATRARKAAVVIPLFNQGAVVGRAIASVLNQTHEDFSLIVVDDGSTDGGADRVAEFRDDRIRCLRRPHQGPGAARNIGIRACSRDWVGLLDADDEWAPEFLQRTLAAGCRATNIALVMTHIAVAGGSSRHHLLPEGRLGDYYSARLRNRVSLSCSSVLLRRDHFLAQGGFSEGLKYAEDTETWFRLVCSGSVYFIPDALSKIHVGTPGSLTKTLNTATRIRGLEFLLETYERYRREGRIPDELRGSCKRFMENQRACLAGHMINSGLRREGLRYLITEVRPGRYNWREYARCLLRAMVT